MTNLKPDFTLNQQEYDALTRIDFWIFVQRVFAELTGENFLDNWHIQLLCADIDQIRTTPNTMLAIALPPRSLKSIIASIALPAWLLGHNPHMQVVCVSYAQPLSDGFAADCRRIMQTPWYRRLFPKTVLRKQAVDDLVTTLGGRRFATSIDGSLTGMGADVIIVDDPTRPDEALSDTVREKSNNWARHTLFTRINRKADMRIIVVHQRLHEEDMIGMVSQIPGFRLLSFPAIAQQDEVHEIRTPFGTLTSHRKEGEALHPAREPLEVLARQRTLNGPRNFAAQYLQSPAPPEGNYVNPAWFGRYPPGALRPFTQVLQSWDCASTAKQLSDYSVCTTWGETHDGYLYLIHVYRVKLEYRDLKAKVRELAQLNKAGTVLIEDTAAGIQLLQELRLEGFARLVPVKAHKDKVMRIAAQAAKIEAGKVFIPATAPWLDDYLHELMMFPNCRYDDQVDSTSQALAWFTASSGPDAWLRNMDEADLLRIGLCSEDLVVTFEHPDPERHFHGDHGRAIRRGRDGFWHCTADEWGRISHQDGTALVERR